MGCNRSHSLRQLVVCQEIYILILINTSLWNKLLPHYLFLHMGQGFLHQLPVLENVILHPHASLVTAYPALRPRDGFSHPHQEHMKDTYILCLVSAQSLWTYTRHGRVPCLAERRWTQPQSRSSNFCPCLLPLFLTTSRFSLEDI